MTRSIPWLRVLIEGVVIVVVSLGLTGCGGDDPIEIDLCEGDAFQVICDPPPGPTIPPKAWVTGSVYLGNELLVGTEGVVQMFFDSTFSVAYEASVDSASGAYGRELDEDDVCARPMFAKARFRVAVDSLWHESGYQQFAPVASCPDTVKVDDIVIPRP